MSDVNLYARWFTSITYNVNGGSGTVSDQIVNSDTSVSLSNGIGISRQGYTFGGWNDRADGTGTNYNVGVTFAFTNNITLYARWSNTLLAENVWAHGTLYAASDEIWLSFPVTAGNRYVVWWNDRLEGNNTRTAGLAVSARYAGSDNWIFGGTNTNVYAGWDITNVILGERSVFTASQTGMIEIRVIPYNRSSSYTGTYSIACTRGGRPEWND